MAEKPKAALVPTQGIPVLILKEGSTRTAGFEALRNNMMAAITVAEMLRTTYGPRGMDKMLVDTIGDVTITNDGATILDKMDVQHPTAKMLVQIAKGQDEEVGDGTKTSVIFAGELLKAAEELILKNVHPTVIVNGYKKALEEATRYAYEISEDVDPQDFEILKKIASTSLTSKAVHGVRDRFAEIAVKAVLQVVEERGGKKYVDIDNIQIIKKHGGSLAETKLVYGIILDKEVVHPGMPKRVENAKIVLLDAPLEIEKTEIDAEIRISDPEQMRKFLEEKENILKSMVSKIVSVGASVVVCQKGIDDVAQHFLAKKNILAVRRVKRSDMEKLERATGGRIVSNIEDLTENDLGYAALIEERKVGEDKMVFIEGTKNPKAVSILIRGGLERVVDEAERVFRDALSVVADIVKVPKIVYGAGAFEIELARHIKDYANKVGGKESLAIEAFAKALEGVAATLVENAGLDPIEKLSELRKSHTQPEGRYYGINVYTGSIEDSRKMGVIEPLIVKTNALKAGTEAATMILRIDDIIAASRAKEEKKEEKKREEE
ncbi:MAG: thermosome subunit beta [Sulfolobales archaeon]|nr:thermosome subunit beta [Sulfolobales archaeon]MDW8082318.1 thermosome subunit beta [Sulfolobales archaeon]